MENILNKLDYLPSILQKISYILSNTNPKLLLSGLIMIGVIIFALGVVKNSLMSVTTLLMVSGAAIITYMMTKDIYIKKLRNQKKNNRPNMMSNMITAKCRNNESKLCDMFRQSKESYFNIVSKIASEMTI
jgi:cation transport ATPase